MKSLVALVGMQHRPQACRDLLAALPNGEPLQLVREPANEYDPRAVQVWARGLMIGYVKGSQNRGIASRLDSADPDDKPTARLAIDGGKWPMIEIDS